jgi:hypothetical protein
MSDQPYRALISSNLAAALRARFGRTGRLADLDEAITAGRNAVADTPPHDPDRPGRLSSLGNALLTRFERTGHLADLDEAITAGRNAVATTPPNGGYRVLVGKARRR